MTWWSPPTRRSPKPLCASTCSATTDRSATRDRCSYPWSPAFGVVVGAADAINQLPACLPAAGVPPCFRVCMIMQQ